MTSATPTETKLITGEELYAMGDIGPSELIDGRIMPMSPTGDAHGETELNLGAELRAFVRERQLGRVMVGETGIYIHRNPDRIRAADVLFISKERLPETTGKYLQVAPELVVEIMSPTDLWLDVRAKIDDYFSIGVEQVWIVEPDTRSVLVFRSATAFTKLGMDDTLTGEGALDGFSLSVASLFA
ncbi:MAG: Uma2 family endonuclease [Anaerolineae bacterium]